MLLVQDTRSFLCRSSLLPGESLASLLVRLAGLNAYPSANMVFSVVQERLAVKDVLARPVQTGTYQMLADFIRLTSANIYQATPYVFTGILTLPDDEMMPIVLPDDQVAPGRTASFLRHHIRSTHRAAYCPRCLQNAPYHRLAWMPFAVNICREHLCLLVSSCPVCQSLLRLTDVVSRRCRKCRFDLTQAVTTDVSADTFGLFAQTMMMSWFGLATEEANLPTMESWWAASLPQQPKPVLYRLVTGIQRSLRGFGPEWAYWPRENSCFPPDSASLPRHGGLITSLPPETAYLFLATAFKALINWPQGFYAFLDAHLCRHGSPGSPKFPQDFGTLYRSCLARDWSSPPFQFVQAAFDDYLVEKYPLTASLFTSQRYYASPQLANRFPCMPAGEAAERLQIPLRVLERLTSLGFLTRYRERIAENSLYLPDFIGRSAVLRLQQRWGAGLPAEDVARLLGVSLPVLTNLIQAEMLTITGEHPAMNNQPILAQEPVMVMLERLLYGASLRKLELDTRYLSEMAPALIRYGYQPAAVIQLARKHLIRFGWERQPGRQFGTFWVSTEDLDCQLELLVEDRPFLSRWQAARQLQVTVAALMNWSQQGFIPYVWEPGMGCQFSREDLAAFMDRYVILEEAAYLSGVYTATLQRWIKKGCLSPVSGRDIDGCHRPLFLRADVERLRLSRCRKA